MCCFSVRKTRFINAKRLKLFWLISSPYTISKQKVRKLKFFLFFSPRLIITNIYIFFKCETQWFHFVCVGLNSAPKGKWYCQKCVEIRKKRKEKQLLSSLVQATSSTSSMLTTPAAGLSATSSSSTQNESTSSMFQFLNTASTSSSTLTGNPSDKKFI